MWSDPDPDVTTYQPSQRYFFEFPLFFFFNFSFSILFFAVVVVSCLEDKLLNPSFTVIIWHISPVPINYVWTDSKFYSMINYQQSGVPLIIVIVVVRFVSIPEVSDKEERKFNTFFACPDEFAGTSDLETNHKVPQYFL